MDLLKNLDNMITAEKIILNKYNIETLDDIAIYGDIVVKFMIEFAKLHVEAALKAASEKADDHSVQVGMHYAEYDGLLDSILTSYPLENIK